MKTVAIVGFGTMGRAIGRALERNYQIVGLGRADDLSVVGEADFVILAVKPQLFESVSERLQPFIQHQTVISIMAGIWAEQIGQRLGLSTVVRTMPNLGLAESASLTGAYILSPGGLVDQATVTQLLEHWGTIVWLADEAQFDAFTAIAGCGPAYFFEVAHQLQQAAEALGFAADQARQLANGALMSAAAVLGDNAAADKVQQVASKGGVTEAALQVFEQAGLSTIIDQAVRAAADRSRELSS